MCVCGGGGGRAHVIYRDKKMTRISFTQALFPGFVDDFKFEVDYSPPIAKDALSQPGRFEGS